MGNRRPARGEIVLAKWGESQRKRKEKRRKGRNSCKWKGSEEGHTGHQSKRSALREPSNQSLRGRAGAGKVGKEASVGQASQALKQHPPRLSSPIEGKR